MRDILQSFDIVLSVVQGSSAERAEVDIDRRDRLEGAVDGVLYYHDGSRLEFTEDIVIERRVPLKLVYRYQYVRVGEPVFRYDNAEHHRDLPGFPHHKHVGGQTLPVTELTLAQVLEEIARVMRENGDVSPGVPGRRQRQRKETADD